MIGTTGTCYNRALNAWKGMMILTMARGGWLNVCHGNIDLLSDDDACWMAKSAAIVYEGTAVWKYFGIRFHPR